VTGEESGLVVLDVDRPEALNGWQSDTLTAHTGKGQHFYFSVSGVAAKNSVSKLAQGLDLRAEGGYVVAPPSRHASGVSYTWRDFDKDPQPAPAWLVQPNPIPEGQRNEALFKIASAMRGKGKDLYDILGELDLVNLVRCIPPLPHKEVRTIAESAMRYEPDAVESTPPRSFISLNELERLCRERPTNYLIEGFLPANDVHVAVGDSGLGKTPWAYQLGLCVATGEAFLGYPTRQGRVLYIDLENGPDAIVSVARSLCGHLGIRAFPDEFLVRGDEAIPVLAEVVAQYQPELVIIDTLRPFRPTAEKSNDEMGVLLNHLRSTARSGHCTILVLHHVRKPGENGVPPLEETPALEWLLQAAGARALINQTNTRIAFDYQRNNPKREAALLMKFFIKMKGETGPIYLERVCNTEGEPAGYRRMVGSQLLGNDEQAATYARLPEEFAFKEAEIAYGRTSDPTRKFLVKCIDIGILEQTTRGRYRKVIPIEKVEQVEDRSGSVLVVASEGAYPL
jgi:AAA domain/Bifunctional DNA primase/polymerase, N-terminal/Primase C terminal 1 (PriCT-1)